MIPKLYDGMETSFEHNGLGSLVDLVECIVEEERNGLFDLSMKIPVGSFLFSQIKIGNIVKANASDRLKNQLFRIKNISKPLDGIVSVYAKHISFDLSNDSIEKIDINHQSCEYALNQIFQKSRNSKRFKGYSDINEAKDYKNEKINCLSAVVDKENSILSTFGTNPDILRDNFNINILKYRGNDNNVLIAYKKNMTGFDHFEEENDDKMITVIEPFATYKDSDDNEVTVKIYPEFVESTRVNNYKSKYVKWIDFSDEFEDDEVPSPQKLKDLSKKYFEDSKCDIPNMTYKIEFIPLSKSENYKEYKHLEELGLGDKVHILNSMYDIRDQARVIKTKYNVLSDRYISIELGDPKSTLSDLLSSGSDKPSKNEVQDMIDNTPSTNFPNILPDTPVLDGESHFNSMTISWTYEGKSFYNYELYASQVKGFTPNEFDLVYKGQASTYLHTGLPDQDWYFRVRAVNSHGKATKFSNELKLSTFKIDNASNYFKDAAIDNALIKNIHADKISAGKIKGNYIDARELTVTDGNNKRTLDIDSYGNISMNVTSLNISSKNVYTSDQADKKIEEEIGNATTSLNNNISGVKNSVDNLKKTTEDALKDNTLTDNEKRVIQSNLKPLEGTFKDVSEDYKNLYDNTSLEGTPKTELKTTYDAYTVKYNNLVKTINDLLKLTAITEANKTTLNNAYNDYNTSLGNYRVRSIKAVDAIADNKQLDVKTELKDDINKIQIGGKNLLQGTSNFDKASWGSSPTLENGLEDKKAIINKRTNWVSGQQRSQIVHILRNSYFEKDMNVTLSGYYWIDSSVAISGTNSDNIMIRYTNQKNEIKDICSVTFDKNKVNQWVRFEITSKVPYDKNDIKSVACTLSIEKNGYVKMTLPMFEKSTKASSYSPAPEDVQTQLDSKAEVSNVYTKTETDSAIGVLKDKITLEVSQKYETITTVESKVKNVDSKASTALTNANKGISDAKTASDNAGLAQTTANNANDKANALDKLNFNNFSKTGKLDGWSPSGSGGNDKLILIDDTTYGKVGRITSDKDIQVLSDYYPVDSSKSYKLGLTLKKDSDLKSSIYFGLNCYDASMNNIGCYIGNTTTLNTNVYYYNATTKVQHWLAIEGYLMASNIDKEKLPKGKNTGTVCIMHPKTRYVKLRFLNYYHDVGKPVTMDYAQPIIYEIDSVAGEVQKQIETTISEIKTTSSKVSTLETNLGSITQRVSNSETTQTNINNKVTGLETRVKTAESRLTDESLTTTIKKNFYTKSEADTAITNKGYQTESQVKQTVDEFELKFIESGGSNLLKNSGFKDGFKYWNNMRLDSTGGGNNAIVTVNWEDTKQEWVLPNRNVLSAYVTDIPSTSNGKQMRAGFDSNIFKVNGNKKYTFQGMFAWHRSKSITIEYICFDSKDTRLSTGSHVLTEGKVKYSGGRDRSKWLTHRGVFTTHNDADHVMIRVYMNEYVAEPDSGSSCHIWLGEPIVVEGDKQIIYTPNSDEMGTGITSIDRDGITIRMNTGEGIQGYSKISHDGLSVFDSYGKRKAWFGDSDSAYINKLKAEDVECSTIIKKAADYQNINLYVAPQATGDGTGVDINNKSSSVTHALETLRKSKGSYLYRSDLNIKVDGGIYNETVYIGGWLGTGVISVTYSPDATLYGNFIIEENTMVVGLNGGKTWATNSGAIIETRNTEQPFWIRNCVARIVNFRSRSWQGSWGEYGQTFCYATLGSNVWIHTNDVVFFNALIKADKNSHVSVGDNKGHVRYLFDSCGEGASLFQPGTTRPMNEKNINEQWACQVDVHDGHQMNSDWIPKNTTKPPPPENWQWFEQTFTLNNLRSIPEGGGHGTSDRWGEWGQGSWGGYKAHRGHADVPQSLRDFCNGARNISMTINMHRSSSAHGYAGSTPKPKVRRQDGSIWDSGHGFARNEWKSFGLPDDIKNSLVNGGIKTMQLWAGGSNSDYSFYDNTSIKVRCEKKI